MVSGFFFAAFSPNLCWVNFYLSSFRIGDATDQLKAWAPRDGRKIGYVPNALDFTTADPERRRAGISFDLEQMHGVGLDTEMLDLKDYFGAKRRLQEKLDGLGGVWLRGGNSFVLRQAMRLSGMDELIIAMLPRTDFLYGGYSAGGCVLSPDLSCYTIVDNPHDHPYPQLQETVWTGLGIIPFAFMPHYDSDHPESADVGREIQRCIDAKQLFKALRDGEVLVFSQT